jgi:hypothetical protein
MKYTPDQLRSIARRLREQIEWPQPPDEITFVTVADASWHYQRHPEALQRDVDARIAYLGELHRAKQSLAIALADACGIGWASATTVAHEVAQEPIIGARPPAQSTTPRPPWRCTTPPIAPALPSSFAAAIAGVAR